MSCTNPLYALKLPAINDKTGKQMQKVLPRREGWDYFSLCAWHGKDNINPLPCGKCASCIEARSKSWAIRCLCEAGEYRENCFITLTYNDKCCPKFLVKKDFQKFMKRLRKHFPDRVIRYYAVGEYGPHGTHRPHWHAILFNFFPSDAKVACMNKDNGFYFTSKELQKIWPFGFISVAECTYQSCAYVARYCQKKLGDPDHREVSLMSLKPGIGTNYLEKNMEKIYKYDAIFGNYGKSISHRPPRYFDKLFERCHPSRFQSLKKERINVASSQVISDMLDHGFRYYEQLCNYKAVIKNDKFNKLTRKDL